jgi:hypothetical protein
MVRAVCAAQPPDGSSSGGLQCFVGHRLGVTSPPSGPGRPPSGRRDRRSGGWPEVLLPEPHEHLLLLHGAARLRPVVDQLFLRPNRRAVSWYGWRPLSSGASEQVEDGLPAAQDARHLVDVLGKVRQEHRRLGGGAVRTQMVWSSAHHHRGVDNVRGPRISPATSPPGVGRWHRHHDVISERGLGSLPSAPIASR